MTLEEELDQIKEDHDILVEQVSDLESELELIEDHLNSHERNVDYNMWAARQKLEKPESLSQRVYELIDKYEQLLSDHEELQQEKKDVEDHLSESQNDLQILQQEYNKLEKLKDALEEVTPIDVAQWRMQSGRI